MELEDSVVRIMLSGDLPTVVNHKNARDLVWESQITDA